MAIAPAQLHSPELGNTLQFLWRAFEQPAEQIAHESTHFRRVMGLPGMVRVAQV
jgi:hypothetical protein